MEPKKIESITNDIHRRFPEVEGIKPKVRRQPIPKSQGQKPIPPDKRNYLLTFKTNVTGPKGQVIPRWVRVVATPKGKVVKITTSK
jgi:hypothetical protein